MQNTHSQPRQGIQQFHQKVIAQLTLNLKRYHKPKPILTNTPNNNHSVLSHDQSETQYFSQQVLSQFLYDILQLQNASIDFIMKDIFEAQRKSLWHLEDILKTVLDVQFVISVNNSILAMNQQLKNNEKQLSFIKINPSKLTQIIHQNCFFLQNTQNSVSKQLIHLIVDQINQQNGNKGYILLVEYKTFILNNMIQKHNIRKFSPFTPVKSKPFTPINRDKYNDNSESIKEVDEESQAMERSRRNFSMMSVRDNELQLDQYSKIKGSQLNQNNLVNEFNNHAIRGDNITVVDKQDNQSIGNVVEKVRQQFLSCLQKEFTEQMPHQRFIISLKQFISNKFTQWQQKYQHRLYDKISKLCSTSITIQQRLSLTIRLIGQHGFKIYHDQISKNPSLTNPKPSYFLSTQQVSTILMTSYSTIIQSAQSKPTLQDLAAYVVDYKGQFLHQSSQKTKYLSFKDLLCFLQQLSRPPTH